MFHKMAVQFSVVFSALSVLMTLWPTTTGSDDITLQSLSAMVQQQADLLQEQGTKIQELQNKVASLTANDRQQSDILNRLDYTGRQKPFSMI